ncbi:UDP-4-amino-4,6-dideoxy-N-acetyl-beta-L-altrosamine N-acetyltransferase [Desmospora profundinema]|uniref:UDP-4-amino-4, 6-dideoxy-N-acetyl-beta-L-altrosamine N-acetyltransferase n=1 Tax=Desmospora profundinema TaxID=1571184 RepID=A0ABU1IHS1_9BACL|nr:UDP-4-amino-4,6-dideoxy-N-acetyl-beta-L-altrosamine N-acetyltransferase [Desmospora profundinema]MDR6224322.1 UDP-4-amino-4,6-dideoxy-N-acetyl-beta-L-altrosamine N-acetyltransferase [Desmospora profundinema]
MCSQEYRLRPVKEEELPILLKWRNSERVRDYLYFDHLITWDEHQAWFRGKNPRYLRMFEWFGKPAGIVSYSDVDLNNNRSLWGFYLGEENLPKGTGMKMLTLGLAYAFETLRFHKVIGEVLAFNHPSIRIHHKLGFRLEGIYAQHVWKAGRFQDVLSFAMLRDDWEKQKES